MMDLPDPRRFASGSVTDALVLAAIRAERAQPLERPRAVAALQRALEGHLAEGREAALEQAIGNSPNAAVRRLLTDTLAAAIDAASVQGGIVGRAFALPLVLVAGSDQAATLPGRLRDVAALQALFERSQALGPTRNFGLADALCTREALESLSPRGILQAARGFEPHALADALAPAPVRVLTRSEQAHLRFVIGMGITAAHSPGFLETAADIGRWGKECAQLLQVQLATGGVQLLALPRPPVDLLRAPHAGRHAQLEAALALFASNALRRFRFAVGDPVAIVSAHESGEIRVSLSSPFAEDMVEGFSWPLHPYDDLGRVRQTILALCKDMQLRDVRVPAQVLPAERANGVPWYPRESEAEALGA